MVNKMLNYINSVNNTVKLIAGIVVIVFVAFLLIFQTISINQLNLRIQKEQQILDESKKTFMYLKEIKSNFPKYQQKLFILESALPSSISEESIISSIQETSEISLLDLSKISIGESVQKEGYCEVGLSLNFSGSFENLLGLFDNLTFSKRAMSVSGINISKDKSSSNKLTAEIKAVSFYTSASSTKSKKAS
jgi:Tfp pilus assembly protein PilO